MYVYILRLKNRRLYVGVTKDLKRRWAEHKSGKVRSTHALHPILIHYECYTVASDARRRERFLKTTEGKRLLKQQIKDLLQSDAHSGIV